MLNKHYYTSTVGLLAPFLDNIYTTFAGAEFVAASIWNFSGHLQLGEGA